MSRLQIEHFLNKQIDYRQICPVIGVSHLNQLLRFAEDPFENVIKAGDSFTFRFYPEAVRHLDLAIVTRNARHRITSSVSIGRPYSVTIGIDSGSAGLEISAVPFSPWRFSFTD